MILGMGIPELAIILIVVLLIFGPKNLPKIGSALGKTVKNVREGMEEGKDETDAEPAPAASDVEVVDDPDDEDSDADSPIEDHAGDARYCPKCGAKNAADSGFCCKCGNKLD